MFLHGINISNMMLEPFCFNYLGELSKEFLKIISTPSFVYLKSAKIIGTPQGGFVRLIDLNPFTYPPFFLFQFTDVYGRLRTFTDVYGRLRTLTYILHTFLLTFTNVYGRLRTFMLVYSAINGN